MAYVLDPKNTSSLSSQLLAVVKNVLHKEVTTAFIAQVTNVYKDDKQKARVDVELINTFLGENNKELEAQKVENLLVGISGGSSWNINLPISKGDIGLCITSKYDLTSYLSTGQKGKTICANQFDIADSIFIPLSLNEQKEIKKDFIISLNNDKVNITIKESNDIVIKLEKAEINISKDGDMSIKCNKIKMDTKSDVEIKATGQVKVEGQTVSFCGATAASGIVSMDSPCPLIGKHSKGSSKVFASGI